jgi:hypothetical protein
MPHRVKRGTPAFERGNGQPFDAARRARDGYHLIINNFRPINGGATAARNQQPINPPWEDRMTISRRRFVGGVAGAGVASLAAPGLVFGQGDGAVRIGL